MWIATSDSIIRIDATSREVTDSIEIDGTIVELVASTDAAWALDSTGTVSRVDSDTRRVDTFEVPAAASWFYSGHRLLITDNALWVSHPAGFDRIDISTFVVDKIAYRGNDPVRGREWLGQVDGALWLHDIAEAGVFEGEPHRRLTRIDLATRQAEPHDVPFTSYLETSAVLADNAVWFVDGNRSQVARFDLESMQLSRLPKLGQGLGRGVYTDGAFWVPNIPLGPWTDRTPGSITRIDESTLEVTDVIAIPFRGSIEAVDDESIWISHGEDEKVSRIDIATRQLTHVIDIGSDISEVLAFDGGILVLDVTGEINRVKKP